MTPHSICPHCARLAADAAELRERVMLYRQALLGEGWSAPRELGLTPSEERIVRLFVGHERVSLEKMMLALYGSNTDEWKPESVWAMLCYIRRKLRPHGITIHHPYGGDYWMVPKDCARLREWAGGSALAEPKQEAFL